MSWISATCSGPTKQVIEASATWPVRVPSLSASTAAYDRTVKFDHYRRLESLQDYLLVAQDAPKVERYSRRGPHHWEYWESLGADDEVELPSLGVLLSLREIYEGLPPGARRPGLK